MSKLCESPTVPGACHSSALGDKHLSPATPSLSSQCSWMIQSSFVTFVVTEFTVFFLFSLAQGRDPPALAPQASALRNPALPDGGWGAGEAAAGSCLCMLRSGSHRLVPETEQSGRVPYNHVFFSPACCPLSHMTIYTLLLCQQQLPKPELSRQDVWP